MTLVYTTKVECKHFEANKLKTIEYDNKVGYIDIVPFIGAKGKNWTEVYAVTGYDRNFEVAFGYTFLCSIC